ncbi:Uncharacterized membrane protein [Frankineae bacterium MT45]|nr:Uncharacterized membrane protein [Frankineae bacterium MT45]
MTTDQPGSDDAPVDSPRLAVADAEAERDAVDGDAATENATAEESPDVAAKPSRFRPLITYTLPGCWFALIFACLSFTPSLLPRGGFIQGLVVGINAAIGYGLGVVAAWIWRAFADRDTRPTRRGAWRTFFVAGTIAFGVMFGLGQYWQHEIRDLMGVTDFSIPLVIASPFVAAITFALLVLVGRGIRRMYRFAARVLRRWIGPRAAAAVGWILAAGVTYLIISGVLLDGLVGLANDTFSVKDGTTDKGVNQPTTSLRSGGPGSLVPWDSLGRQGRKFTGLGPSAAEISALTHEPAQEPIRIYAGLQSAQDAESRATLAVQDLERAGGFQRKNLLVVTTTGSGWVDPAMVDSLEYLTGGDTATVAIQYSYLPSWISYLVDQSKAREAGRSLFDAVYEEWSKLPQNARPRLLVAGESLGSFGGETAFSGEYDLRNRTNGTLFAGPPNFNTLFREFTDNRDAGSPEVQPVYKNGRTVRFTNDPSGAIPPYGQPWDGTRVLYLMHPSDPIVWWSPKLILHKPDWTSQEPGSDVLSGIVWMPFITFWQVTADLPFATGVPAGHGHKYTAEYVDGWNAVLQPAGVTPAEITQLKDVIAGGS